MPSVTRRYVFRAGVIEMASGANEFWFGIQTDREIDFAEWDDLVPADGMSDEELAVVKDWLTV